MGLCSGADNSHRVSLKDKRVVGTVNLDGLSFRTPTYFFKFYGERLFSGRFLMEKLKRMRSQKIALKEKSKQEGLSDPVAVYLGREFPTKEKAIKDFKSLVSRGVKLLYIFTGDVQHYNNYKNQLRDSIKEVDFQDFLDLEYYPYAQHTYTTINSREKAIKRIVYWLDKHFGS